MFLQRRMQQKAKMTYQVHNQQPKHGPHSIQNTMIARNLRGPVPRGSYHLVSGTFLDGRRKGDMHDQFRLSMTELLKTCAGKHPSVKVYSSTDSNSQSAAAGR